jgi:hypothetical protein
MQRRQLRTPARGAMLPRESYVLDALLIPSDSQGQHHLQVSRVLSMPTDCQTDNLNHVTVVFFAIQLLYCISKCAD